MMKKVTPTRLEKTVLDRTRETLHHWMPFLTPKVPVIVGVSGGKDSLVLLRVLSRFSEKIVAVHDGDTMEETTRRWCEQFAPLHVIPSEEPHSAGQESCFLCSRKRRKRLFETAKELGIGIIALGHHRDDVIETLLLNMVFSREISAMKPVQNYFENHGIRFGDQEGFRVIRPFYSIPEHLLAKLAEELAVPVSSYRCAREMRTKRLYMKELIHRIGDDHPRIDVADNIFSSLFRVNADFLPQENQQA